MNTDSALAMTCGAFTVGDSYPTLKEGFVLRVMQFMDNPENTTMNITLEKFNFDEHATPDLMELINAVPLEEASVNTVAQLRKAANNIAASSRRGAGNLLVASKNFLDALTKESINSIYPGIAVLETPALPEGDALLLFKGSNPTDSPFFYYYDDITDTTIFKAHPDYLNYVRRLHT